MTGKTLLADREYIGQKWFDELLSLDLEMIIRIRKSDYKSIINSFEGKTHQQLSLKVIRSKKKNKVSKQTDPEEYSDSMGDMDQYFANLTEG